MLGERGGMGALNPLTLHPSPRSVHRQVWRESLKLHTSNTTGSDVLGVSAPVSRRFGGVSVCSGQDHYQQSKGRRGLGATHMQGSGSWLRRAPSAPAPHSAFLAWEFIPLTLSAPASDKAKGSTRRNTAMSASL